MTTRTTTTDLAAAASRSTVEVPKSLFEAHEMVRRNRPKSCADQTELVAHYRYAANVYIELAKVDRVHKHEALAYASEQTRTARAIEDELGINQD